MEIIDKAVTIYGKRKVVDHLCFLIDTRSKQRNGEHKFNRALKIWRSDKEYVSLINI